MEFRFKHSSCVAVGTFNIYIVQPKLLSEMGVLEGEQPVMISGDLTQPGIRFQIEDCTWIVRPDRLAVESNASSVNCGDYVAKTLTALCWTPIMAVGINSVFTAPGEIVDELPPELQLPRHDDAIQQTVHLAIKRGGGVSNLQLSQKENTLELSLNYHTDFSKNKANHRDINSAVTRLCSSFLDQRKALVEFAKANLSAEIVYDH